MSGEKDKVVDLVEYRKQKYNLVIEVDKYYRHPEMGVHLHCIGKTLPMHTKNNEIHFIVEDHFGNLATFRIDDAPPGFVVSSFTEFKDAAMGIEPPEVS